MQTKDWLGQQLKTAITSRTGVKTRRWLGLGGTHAANHELDHIPVPGDVVVYFSDVVNKSYQLEQWLPTLEKLHETHRVVLVFRKIPTMRHFRKLTTCQRSSFGAWTTWSISTISTISSCASMSTTAWQISSP